MPSEINIAPDFTPQQKQGLLNLLSKTVVDWTQRKIINVAQIITKNITTGNKVKLENQARVVIDQVLGIVVYDQQNNVLAQIKLDQVTGATTTPLYLMNNGSLKQVLWDGTQLHF